MLKYMQRVGLCRGEDASSLAPGGEADIGWAEVARRRGQSEQLDLISEQIQVARLRDAIATRRLALAAQEIVDLRDGSTVMHELLARYVDDSGEVVPAQEFLCLAETHRVIEEIDGWVLEQAVDIAAAGGAVALNVSAQTMSDPAYADKVLRLITGRQVNPRQITFEITETALVENLKQAEAFGPGWRCWAAPWPSMTSAPDTELSPT
jgi:predicted signal transduction protein with EAL and GGDEF domain